MKQSVLNRLKLKRTVASSIPGSTAAHRAWVGVIPLRPSIEQPFEREARIRAEAIAEASGITSVPRIPRNAEYHVWIFEVLAEDMSREDFESDYDRYLLNERHLYPESLADLLDLLDRLVENTDTFDVPWKCDYPI